MATKVMVKGYKYLTHTEYRSFVQKQLLGFNTGLKRFKGDSSKDFTIYQLLNLSVKGEVYGFNEMVDLIVNGEILDFYISQESTTFKEDLEIDYYNTHISMTLPKEPVTDVILWDLDTLFYLYLAPKNVIEDLLK